MLRVGLLNNHVMALRQSLELYLLNPAQMIAWIGKRAGVGPLRAVMVLLRESGLSSLQEKRMILRMQKLFRRLHDPRSVIDAAQEKQPCRNKAEIRNLLERLAIPIVQFRTFPGCYIVRTQ